MADVITHDLVIFGAGLAGLRAAIEASRVSRGKIDIAIVSKNHLMRAHSVAAEGGTSACMRPEDGDSVELHAWDTIKGSDFLADQDAVELFVRTIPREIVQLDHWGIPWSRRGRPWHSVRSAAQLSASRAGAGQDRLLRNADALRHPSSVQERPALQRALRHFDPGGNESLRSDRAEHEHGSLRSDPAKSMIIASGGGEPFSDSPRTPRPSPATAWHWHTGRACRWRTWSSSNSTRPALFLRES